MKRILALILVLVMAVSLCACGGTGTASAGGESKPAASSGGESKPAAQSGVQTGQSEAAEEILNAEKDTAKKFPNQNEDDTVNLDNVGRFDADNSLKEYTEDPSMSDFETMKQDYIRLLIREGVNLQPGQRLVISAAVDLATLACGRHDIFFEMRLKPWDYAAGSLLVREAGGCFAMPLLESPDFGASTAIFAAAPSCFEKALDVFRLPEE